MNSPLEVVTKLQSAGFRALWAGGCVRDQLLGLAPNDYDVATEATPDQIREVFGRRKTLAIGASFGVITVLGPKSAGQIEVATFRTDGGYSDGRRPDSVTFSTAEEDAQRRDFTINGLFFDPLEEKVIDYVGGQEDLQQGRLRAIGNPHERIEEDKLRMLRAVRFAATFDLTIESTTLRAIREHHRELDVVSEERVGAELRKMLAHRQRHHAYRWLLESQLFEQVVPGLPNRASAAGQDDRCFETLRELPVECGAPAALAAIVLNHGEQKAENEGRDSIVHQICRRLKWSNKETEKTRWISNHVGQLAQAHERKWSEVQPLLIVEHAREAVSVGEALARVLQSDQRGLLFCRAKLFLPPEELNPPPLVKGSDLHQLELPAGPLFKTILQRVRDAQLDGEVQSHEQAVDLARSLADRSESASSE